MSSNDLEVRVSELTNVIRGLSNKPLLSSNDVNNILNSLVQRVEDTNEAGFDKLTSDVSDSLLKALEDKNKDIKERLEVFETLVSSVETSIKNPKMETEIRRVLDDIEALHSKLNSQEIQTENLLKSFESFRASTSSSLISKLTEEIAAISGSYQGIVDVLNKNFEEFLMRVESMSSKEEFQRIKRYLENIEGNQNVLVGAMNVLGEKQEEIKTIIKQSSNTRSIEKIEQFQSALNQMARRLNDSISKADLEIISDKMTSAINLINSFKNLIEERNENDLTSVLTGQLNNITSKIENLKQNPDLSINEDIIRLYTSIAELKDGVYSSINDRLQDAINSIDTQFDKISNAMVNSAIDSNETVTNLSDEIKKLTGTTEDNFAACAVELKENIKKCGQENVVTVVNSIKGELANVIGEISLLNNNDVLSRLIKDIEALQGSFDTNSILLQMEEIKSALDFTPLKEQMEALNKEDVLENIQERIELVLDFVRSDEIVTKLDEINKKINLDSFFAALNSINGKLDFTSIEGKISDLKNFLNNSNLSSEIASVKEKLTLIDNLGEELIAVKSLDSILTDIKGKLEEVIRNNSNKIAEDIKSQNEIKKALDDIYQLVSSKENNASSKDLTDDIKNRFENISSQISDKISENGANIQNVLDKIREEMISIREQSGNELINMALEDVAHSVNENLNNVALKVNESVGELGVSVDAIKNTVKENLNVTSFRLNASIKEIAGNIDTALANISEKIESFSSDGSTIDKEKIEKIEDELKNLSQTIQNVATNPIAGQIDQLAQNILSSSADNYKEMKRDIENIKENITENFNLLKENISPKQEGSISNNALISMFDELEARLNDKFVSLETLLEEVNSKDNNIAYNEIREIVEGAKEETRLSFEKAIEQLINSKVENLFDFIKNELKETLDEVNENIKQKTEILTSAQNEKFETTQKEILTKIAQMLAAKENSEARINLIKSITENLNEILNNTFVLKSSFQENTDVLSEINESLEEINSKFNLQNNIDVEGILNRVVEKNKESNSNLADAIDKNNKEIEENINTIKEAVSSIHNKIAETVNENSLNIEQILSSVNETMSLISSKVLELAAKDDAGVIKDAINRLDCSIEAINSKINDKNNNLDKETTDSLNDTIGLIKGKMEDILSAFKDSENKFASITSGLDNIQGKMFEVDNELKRNIEDKICSVNFNIEEARGTIDTAIGDFKNENNEKFTNLNSNLDELRYKVTDTVNESISKVDALNSSLEDHKTKMMDAFTVTNSAIEEKFNQVNSISELLQNKMSDLIIQNNSDLRNAIGEISESIQEANIKVSDLYSKNEHMDSAYIASSLDNLSNELASIQGKLEALIRKSDYLGENQAEIIKQEIQEKTSELEALLNDSIIKMDSKAFEILNSNTEMYNNRLDERINFLIDVIGRNNEAIKDDFKTNSDSYIREVSRELKDKIDKIESVLIKADTNDENKDKETYTLGDIEADIEKIKLGLEKSNKLSNFKEFAARLVELKNINLENAKISRVIGADIMRFDNWLKNTSDKIDVLSAKIDKSEKIKMEDLKTRVNQNDKAPNTSQKLEEAIMSIYKKYRIQETKIDEMVSKIEAIAEKENEGGSIKEFIDLFYDNTKKQENLIRRMDGIEDKMDLIQAKIDHIISSCIDE